MVIYKNTKTGAIVRLAAPNKAMDQSQRWQRVEETAEPADPAGGQEPGRYDPADHTVDEVNAYLADVDLAERERIIQAEAEGKARRGIISGPYSDLSGA
ncbi:hypothetical protein [Thermomonospora cellulosilytica]|uniref:hypothetical protein n=1 Tax=Thermomonospora cellulosilytica TaxID=1411118 RepID=UPI0015FC6C6E|nr:hypothetical protein [Thermomonospora cellulosilytica]